MAWMDDLTLPGSTVTGHFGFVTEDGPDADTDPDILVVNGSVLFEPTANAVRAGGAWIGIQPVTAQIESGAIIAEDGAEGVRILSTEADTGVENWGWKATFDIAGASIQPIRFRAPISGVHLTGDELIPITGLPVEIIGKGAMDRLVTAEELLEDHGARLAAVESTVTAHASRLDAVEATVDRIKLANQSAGEGAPTGAAPVGWVYTDLTTGDIYRMEA